MDELPPAYVPSGASGVASIRCKVCQAMINLEGSVSQIVIKCSSCNEATVRVGSELAFSNIFVFSRPN